MRFLILLAPVERPYFIIIGFDCQGSFIKNILNLIRNWRRKPKDMKDLLTIANFFYSNFSNQNWLFFFALTATIIFTFSTRAIIFCKYFVLL